MEKARRLEGLHRIETELPGKGEDERKARQYFVYDPNGGS